MIDIVDNIIAPIVEDLSGGPEFIHGDKSYYNETADDIDYTNGSVFLYAPLVENWKTPANSIRPTSPLLLFFGIKSALDLTPKQRRPGIMQMKALAKEFILRLQELEDSEGRSLLSAIKNIKVTETINEYDAILDGVILELEIDVIDYSSLCLSK